MLLVLVLRNPVTELYMSSSRSKELEWTRRLFCGRGSRCAVCI